MSEFYDEMILVANELITEFGRNVSFQEFSKNITDANKPWKGGTEIIEQVDDVPACFVPLAGSDLGKLGISEELLKRTDQIALVAPVQENLERMHAILDDGVRYKIDWIKTLRPATQTVLYVIGVTR